MITVRKAPNARRVSVRAPEWLAPLLEQAFNSTPAGAGMSWVPATACALEQLDQLLGMAIQVDLVYPGLDRALRLARRHARLGLRVPSPLAPGLAPPSIPSLPRAPGLTPVPGRSEFTPQELAGIRLYLDGVRAIGAWLATLDLSLIEADIQEHQEQAWCHFRAKRGFVSETILR